MLGSRLKKLRLIHHMSQADAAQLLNISRSAYAMYESGRRQIPYEALLILADHYQVSLDYMLGRTEDPEIPRRLSDTEKQFLKQFRQIDKRGQEALLAMLRYEYSRTMAERPSSRS